MTSSESQSEKTARALLEAMGLTVERLPEGTTRMADYRAADANNSYLVEVTERSPDNRFREFLTEADSKGMSILVRTMDRSKALDDKVADKADQLRQTVRPADFKTLWVVAFHDDAKHLCEVLMRTLYGIADLNGVRRPNDPTAFPPTQLAGIYYNPFAFDDFRDLDGVAFVSPNSVCMYVNPLCPRAAEFKQSKLCREFASKNGLFDPTDLADRPEVLFLDDGVDRTDPKAKWDALRRKYGWYTMQTKDSCFQGLISVRTRPV